MAVFSYKTFNSGVNVSVAFDHVVNILADKKTGTWIWFVNGKSIHVTAPYNDVDSDLKSFYKSDRF